MALVSVALLADRRRIDVERQVVRGGGLRLER
jgi:hypothetical protein